MCLALTMSLSAKETIKWVWYEQTPYFTGEGPKQGRGIGDKLTRFYQQHLPEFNHQNIKVNAGRYNMVVGGDNICVPVAWKSAIEIQYLTATRAHTIEPPVGIYFHKSKQHLFQNKDGPLSLAWLLENSPLKLGALRSLDYGKRVNQLIKQYKGQNKMHIVDGPLIQINLRMLKLGRLDYLLGLPSQSIDSLVRQERGEYQFKNIPEINQYIPIYSHCSKSIIGRRIVDRMNSLLTDKKLIKSIDEYEYWYQNDPDFRQLFSDFIIDKKKIQLIQDPQ